MNLQRYLLFCYETYYPLGGWKDFHSDYPDYITALEAAAILNGNKQIVDTEEKK